MTQYHRLVRWDAGNVDITIGKLYDHFVGNDGRIRFRDDVGDSRAISHGIWEGSSVLSEDIQAGDKIILTGWVGIGQDVTLGKLYTARVDLEDGDIVFSDDAGDNRGVDMGTWNATWSVYQKVKQEEPEEEEQENMNTPAQRRGITEGVKLRVIDGEHHHFDLHDITEIARDDGTQAPYFKSKNTFGRMTSCAWLDQMEVLTPVSREEMEDGCRYVLLDWSSIWNDLTVGADYLVTKRFQGDGEKSLIFVDDSGIDIRSIRHGAWAKYEGFAYPEDNPHHHTLELGTLLDMNIQTIAGHDGISDIASAFITTDAGIGIKTEPDVDNPQQGDVFEYHADHGYPDAFPMDRWEDGDELEVVAVREQYGKPVPIMWNERHQTASTVAKGTFRKVDSRIQTLMDEAGLTRSQAIASLRVLDGK